MTLHGALTVGVVALVTALIRFAPFLLFPPGRPMPPYIAYLGRVLPYAAIGMLVVYCLRAVNIQPLTAALPDVLAVALTVFSYRKRRSALLSIMLGTACYMLLIRIMA